MRIMIPGKAAAQEERRCARVIQLCSVSPFYAEPMLVPEPR